MNQNISDLSYVIIFFYKFLTDWRKIGVSRRLDLLKTPQDQGFITPTSSLSGIFLIAKLTLVYPCKPLENRLSRILYTWSLLDVFLTFVRPKDVIRLKIRLFILRHVLPCQTLQYLMSIAYLSQYE